MITACPAAIVNAPVQVVWGLLVDPTHYGWMDGQVIRIVPDGKAHPGQTVSLRSNGLPVRMTVLEVDEQATRIGLLVNLPLGITMEPHISCAPLGEASCRVQYG